MALQQWSVNAQGGFLGVPLLSKKLRKLAQQRSVLRKFTKVEKAYGAKMGDTWLFDRAGNVGTAGNVTGISEANTMPETTVAFTQGSVVVNEFGNSIRMSGKLVTLNTISISDAAENALRDDMVKTLDLAIRNVLRSSDVKFQYSATGSASAPTDTIATGGVNSVTWTRDALAFDVKEIVDYLDGTQFAPPFEDDKYAIISSSAGFHRGVFDSAEFQSVAIRNFDAERMIRGQVGSFYRAHLIYETNSFSVKVNGFRGEFVAMGDDALIEAIALAPEIRQKVQEDYGRNQGLCWYAIWNVNDVWPTNNAGEGRIIRGSAGP